MQVYVAVYSHRYGNCMRVFRTSAGAEEWRIEIADEYWRDAYHDMLKPDDKERMAQMYWDCMIDNEGKNEYFEINVCNVED